MDRTNILNFFNTNANLYIDIQTERTFWKNILLDIFIFPQKNCPNCGKCSLNLNDYESLNNPLITRCSSAKCRKIVFLRDNTFFGLFPRTPCSVITYILYIWFIENKNGNEIFNKLQKQLKNFNISKVNILQILDKARIFIKILKS